MGSSLGGFAAKFGQPFESGGSYVWTYDSHSVITGEASPVVNIVVQHFTDTLEQHRVCEEFLPAEPIFENQVSNDYFFMTRMGEVELSVGDNYCVLQFTAT